MGSDTISRPGTDNRRHCYSFYVVTDCGSQPELQDPIKDRARHEWHEVTKAAHYYLSVDAITRPIQVREERRLTEGRRDA